ncbi:MAG: molybdopterin dehydrogenase [Deltaproteobacteria bacterium]|jgi:carbon-monoxide dehydrogenase medium subunit|nr:molybdopterin dehydrogenase [Deltaproteobacteria bacterium]
MKPARFEYAAPHTLHEAVSLLQQHEDEDVKILAGGQSLVPLLNMRMARPELLVDLNRIGELQYIREEDGWLAIGAMTRKRAVEESELVRQRQPVLFEATKLVGHPQIRNRGTVGGSMAHADPAAEYPALALVLGAEMRAVGPGGERRIAAEDFFQSYLMTALEPVEVLTEVRVPVLEAETGWSFLEVARRHGDFALGGATALVRLDGGGSISQARIVLFGLSAGSVRLEEVEGLLIGQRPGDALYEEAGALASRGLEDPLSDTHASAEYRRHLAGVLTKRALGEAVGRLGAGQPSEEGRG